MEVTLMKCCISGVLVGGYSTLSFAQLHNGGGNKCHEYLGKRNGLIIRLQSELAAEARLKTRAFFS